jgi:hypothetical protein
VIRCILVCFGFTIVRHVAADKRWIDVYPKLFWVNRFGLDAPFEIGIAECGIVFAT